MDDAELKRADEWWRDHWHHGPCPVCQANDWERQPKLGQIENLVLPEDRVEVQEGVFVRQGGRIPAFLVTCGVCGYFLSINAITAGIRQFPPNEGTDEKAGGES